MNKMQKQVSEFMDQFAQTRRVYPELPTPTELLFRIGLHFEENAEFATAAYINNYPRMVDALADILYVVFGTCCTLGIDIEDIFNEVHACNMKKIKGEGLKVVKPENWESPNIIPLIEYQLKEGEDNDNGD